MKRSTGALRSCASSTIVRIRLTEDSASGLVTRAVITPLRETKPASTVSPGSAFRATLSPVSAEVSISETPVSTVASSGGFFSSNGGNGERSQTMQYSPFSTLGLSLSICSTASQPPR